MNQMQKEAKKADHIFYGIMITVFLVLGVFLLAQHEYEQAQSDHRVCQLVNGSNSEFCE